MIPKTYFWPKTTCATVTFNTWNKLIVTWKYCNGQMSFKQWHLLKMFKSDILWQQKGFGIYIIGTFADIYNSGCNLGTPFQCKKRWSEVFVNQNPCVTEPVTKLFLMFKVHCMILVQNHHKIKIEHCQILELQDKKCKNMCNLGTLTLYSCWTWNTNYWPTT